LASEGKSGKEENRDSKLAHTVVAGVFLIGLAVLFYFDLFWPWTRLGRSPQSWYPTSSTRRR